MDLTNFSGSKCRAARRTNRKVKELEVEPECPALSFSFCFLSLRAWFKSPLGEPHSRCQATRLPGSRALMNSHSVMEVALLTRCTQGQTGGQTHACVQTLCGMCAARADRTQIQPLESCLVFFFFFFYNCSFDSG